MQMIILVDMDGTIANWGKEWDSHAIEYSALGLPLTPDQKTFDLTAGLTDEGIAAVKKIMDHPGFYTNLELFDDAATALNDMLKDGHEVFIVTSPWITNVTCSSDKLAWAEKNIGPGWAKRTIITSDKTLIRGDILIDDKPNITGAVTPTWEHVLFEQPYNIDTVGGRRVLKDWSAWRDIVEPTWQRVAWEEWDRIGAIDV